jgi:hypothetical protein
LRFTLSLLAVSLLMISGCDKPTPEQIALLATAAAAAKERAAAFSAIKGTIKAKDSTQQPTLNALLDAHGNGLNSQAIALNDFLEGATKGHSLSDRNKEAIAEMTATAKARHENFEALQKHLELTEAQKVYVAAHLDALKKQSEKLLEFCGKLKPKPKANSPPEQ